VSQQLVGPPLHARHQSCQRRRRGLRVRVHACVSQGRVGGT
jgi:hypothetical protein